MHSILVAAHNEASVRCGLRLAADLSVACGARLGLARIALTAAESAPATEAALSDPLFAPSDWRTPIPRFADTTPRRTDSRDDLPGSIHDYWQEGAQGLAAVLARIARDKPSLVIACETRLARALVAETEVPVWHLHASQAEREWFAMRRLRCATLGSRATLWAQALAASLGAELEVAPRMRDADVTVLTRGVRSTLLTLVAARAAQPVVIV